MKQRPRWTLIAFVIVVLLWILLLYAAFYRVQKPFDADHLVAWLRAAWELVCAGLIVLLGMALGHRLLRQFGFVWASPLDDLAFSFAVGMGILSLLAMGIGMAGGLYRWLFYVLTAGGLALLWRDARAMTQAVRAAWREFSMPRLFIFFLAFVLICTLTIALTPPAAWDALQYHLDGPRLYIQQHRITALDNFSLAYSGLLESLFMWAMLLADGAAAQLVHWVYGLGLLAILYIAGRHLLGNERAWLPVAVLLTMPMVLTLFPWAYNDLALAFYQVAACLALCLWRERGENRWLWLSGVLCGFGLGFKYTAASLPLALAALILWWYIQPQRSGSPTANSVHRKNIRNILVSWSILAAGTAIVSVPWFLRNWALWGNPVYPYLFNGLYWDDLRMAWYQRLGSGIGWNLREILLLPWTASLTLKDVSFREARIGPFFVMVLPLMLITLFIRPRQDQERPPAGIAGVAWGVSALQYALWALGVIQSRSVFQARLLLPTLALFCLPVAVALERLRQFDMRQLSLWRFLLVVLALTLVLNGIDLALEWAREDPLPYLAGVESVPANLNRRLGAYYTTIQEINQRLSTQDRVLFLWETKGYYCRIPCQPDLIVDRLRHLTALEGAAEQVWQRLKTEGYTHVLIYETGLQFMIDLSKNPDTQFVFPDELKVLQDLRGQYLNQVYKNEHYTLYNIKN